MDLFVEIKYSAPSWDYEGTPLKYVQYCNGDKVLVTRSKTINKSIVKLTLYSMGNKVLSARYNKSTQSFLDVDALLVRYYWDYISGE